MTDAYAGVKNGVRRLVHRAAADGGVDGDPDEVVDELIETVEADPEASRAAVAERLTQLVAGVNDPDGENDAELLAAARRVVGLAGADVRVGKYHVDLRDNTGVQVGDHNEMTLNIEAENQRQP